MVNFQKPLAMLQMTTIEFSSRQLVQFAYEHCKLFTRRNWLFPKYALNMRLMANFPWVFLFYSTGGIRKLLKRVSDYLWYTCSRGLFGLCPVLRSYQARWNGMNFFPVHSASYISSHFSISILCISIGQPDSLAIRISEDTSCPAINKYKI